MVMDKQDYKSICKVSINNLSYELISAGMPRPEVLLLISNIYNIIRDTINDKKGNTK